MQKFLKNGGGGCKSIFSCVSVIMSEDSICFYKQNDKLKSHRFLDTFPELTITIW